MWICFYHSRQNSGRFCVDADLRHVVERCCCNCHGMGRSSLVLFNADASVRVEVKAALEDLLQVQAPTSLDLLAAAYHLGNRHVALELHDQELLLLDDSVLAAMLKGRGLVVTPCRRAFLPEGGAYAGHSHRHSSP
jgi:urease accessory protein